MNSAAPVTQLSALHLLVHITHFLNSFRFDKFFLYLL